MTHLENARRYLAERQWSDAVESIRRVQETEPSKLVQVVHARPIAGFERYIPAADYCQQQLGALGTDAPQALAHYRGLVDTMADTWLREGEKNNDETLLQRVVEQAFASRAGDNALLKLGDLRLSRGDSTAARAAWRRIGIYPDSEIDPAAVLTRLVLASILEGSGQLAGRELAELRMRFPQAAGILMGRTGRYADLLQSLLDESKAWPPARQSSDWMTFGGSPSRANLAAATEFQPDPKPLCSFLLPQPGSFPVVVDDRVFVNFDAQDHSQLAALDLKTGHEVWRASFANPKSDLSRPLGATRYTATVADGKILARMGSPVTLPTSRRAATWLAKDQGFLMGLTLQGQPLEGFPIRPPAADWTFEGTPLDDDGLVYVAMRQVSGAGSQLFIAGYALQTTPQAQLDDQNSLDRPVGQLQWRTRVCSSVIPGSGEIDQLTHLLLTKDHDRIYLNTSSGCVAALSANDGKLLWVVQYPRMNPGNRDLSPCVAWNDLIIAAPADCNRIFALEALTGELVWTGEPGAMADGLHVLGVADDTLIVSGDSLYFVDAYTGRVIARYPSPSSTNPARGMGRGVIEGNRVWWPTLDRILVFQTRPEQTDHGWQARLIRDIPLAPHGLTGGNLIIAHGILLIATSDKLTALGN